MGNEFFRSSVYRLTTFLERRFLRGDLLVGPDPVGRINLRLWRFLKYYLPWLHRGDDYLFLQTQGYWIAANWLLYEATGETAYRERAVGCSDAVLALQR